MALVANADSTRAGLLRELGAGQAISIVIGVVIGSGIFLVPAEMMQTAGSAKLVFLAWIVGGVFSFCGAVTYAELGKLKPQAGGEYVYIRDAFGPLPGFLCGWTWTVVVKPGSLAAISTGVVRILGSFSALSFLVQRGGRLTISGMLVAAGFVAFISAVNYAGIRQAGNFQLAFTVLKIALIVGIACLAFTSAGSWGHFHQIYSGATAGFGGFVAAVTAALWAYDGWSDLNMVAEEIRDPERNLPIALIGGLLGIAALYMLVNAAVQFALPPGQIAASASPMSDAVGHSVLGTGAAIIVAVAMIIALTATLNGVAMSGSRITFALARDGNFFRFLSSVHPRFRTPYMAIVVQGVLSVCFLLIGGSFRQLFTLALFAEWLSYTAAAVALFVFLTRGLLPPGQRKMWKTILAPALFIVASGGLLYYTVISNLRYSALGSLAILLGVPVYYAFALRHRV